GLPLEGLTAEVCFTDQSVALRVRGRLGTTELSGSLTSGAGGPTFDLGVTGGGPLTLVPGLTLSNAHVVVVPGATQVTVRGKLCTNGLCVDLAGQWNPSGRS